MKACLTLAVALALPACALAQGKACEDLKAEIAAKLDAKGVKGYSLEILAKDQDTDAKVVGTCEGGTKKITYRKGAAAAQAPAKDSDKP